MSTTMNSSRCFSGQAVRSLLFAFLAIHPLSASFAQQQAKPPVRPQKQPLLIPDVTRDQVICFCLYTTQKKILKLTAILYPLRDDEEKKVSLEVEHDGRWQTATQADVSPEGWTATFRVENWDDSRD